jgi:hypothetical protein
MANSLKWTVYLSSVGIIGVKVQQHVNVKFLATFGKIATETYSLLVEVYGDECLFRTHFLSGSNNLKRERERSKSKSNFKVIIIVFCNIRGIVHIDWVPEG